MSDSILKQFREEQKIISVDARNNLSELFNRCYYGKERFLLMRRTKPLVVIISFGDLEYLRSVQPREEYSVTTVEARNSFSEAINYPFYAGKRVIVLRPKKEVVAFVPLGDLDLLSRKPADPEPLHHPRKGRRIGLDGKPFN